ncbi:MAG: hypothetical protein SOT82_05420 [Oscillospiraceae bacterium]|nr:hypothetical protein [Oscillospiraceae bacterium]
MDLKNLFGYEGKTVVVSGAYPLVAIGSQIFSYMSGQIIYFDYGMSSVWETDALDAASN